MIDDRATDSALLHQFVVDGSEHALARLVERHSGMVLGVCRRILRSPADAEDAAQATFIALALKAEKLTVGTGLGGWLRHIAFDMSKANSRRERRNDDYYVLDVRAESSGDDPYLAEIDAAIAALPAKLRATVIQTYFEGLSLEAIAQLEDCTPSAISMRLTRARKLLRKSLGRSHAVVSLDALIAGAVRGQGSVPTDFALRIAHQAALTSGDAADSAEATARLVASARETLRKLSFATFRWPAAAVVASILMVGLVVGNGETPPAANPQQTLQVPRSNPTNEPPDLPVSAAPLAPLIASAAPADPPLIAALAKIDRWSDLPAFKSVLNQVVGNVDAVRDAAGKTTLHRAARLGYSESMTLLLRRGADVNALDAKGRTPLFDAVSSRSKWASEVLVLWGAQIDQRANDGSTPLIIALTQKDLAMAELLLWLGAKTRLDDLPPERQPLNIAGASGNAALLALVSDYDRARTVTFPAQPRVIPAFIKNALHDAARRDDFLRLEDLLRAGLNLHAPDDKGKTPLHWAIAGGHAEMVFYLLLLGADANAPDRAGVTPFMESLAWMGDGAGSANRLFLIAKSANPNAVRKDGHSECTWAADRDNEHALQWLLWMGADARRVTPQGTPFQVAWRGGRKHILDLLRRNGIDEPIQLPANPAELLQVAARLGDDALVGKALADRAPIDVPDREGNSPLMLAFLHRSVSTARLLIDHGADIHFQNPINHQTPLCSTLPWSGSEVNALRRALLEAGVDVNIQTKRNRTTPLMMALIHGRWLVEELVGYGADLQARDKDGMTVLSHALKTGQNEAAAYLRSIGATE